MDLDGGIAAAIEEQTTTTQEISGNILQLAQGVEEVSSNVSGTATAVSNAALEIDATNQSVSELSNSGAEMTINAENVAKLASKLKKLMNTFKVK